MAADSLTGTSKPSVDAAAAAWYAQFLSLKADLATLPRPSSNVSIEDLVKSNDLDTEDIYAEPIEDDLFDYISDDDQGFIYDTPLTESSASSDVQDETWLSRKCSDVASRKAGLSSDELRNSIVALLSSDSEEAELQTTLTDILGYDDLDLVIDLIARRWKVVQEETKNGRQPGNSGHATHRLLNKHERDEVLRRQDIEHKRATLQPKVNREGNEYPHVYKEASAGNLLDFKGRKYGLPLGSERLEHEVRQRPFQSFRNLTRLEI